MTIQIVIQKLFWFSESSELRERRSPGSRLPFAAKCLPDIASDKAGADKWLYFDPVYPEIFPSWCFLKRSRSRDSSIQISSISRLFSTIKSQVLSPHPHPCQTQITIWGTWNPTTTSCSQMFLDSQGHFHYNPSEKKQGLINSTNYSPGWTRSVSNVDHTSTLCSVLGGEK